MNDTMNSKPRIQRLADLIGDLEKWAEENHAAAQSGKARGPQIAFAPKLAGTVGGHISVGAHYLHAVPNAGKSAFANQIAAECGCPSLIVSSEMGGREIFLRQIARTTNRTLSALHGGTLSTREITTLAQATAAKMPELCILDATASPAPIEEIQQGVRDLRNDDGHLLLVLDSIHSWARRHVPGASEHERITAASAAFEQLAALERIAVVIISERSRATMSTGGMHASKGSSSVEYSARSVWSLNAENDGQRDADGAIGVSLEIAKNKDGASGGTIGFRFFPEYMRFDEVA